MRLPTVKLRHKKTGRTRIVNQTDYARDVVKYLPWEAISWRRGDASEDTVRFSAEQSDIEKARLSDAERERRFGDHRRAQEAQAITVGTPAFPSDALSELPAEAYDEEADGPFPLEETDPDRPSLFEGIDPASHDWKKLRQLIKDHTGKYPRSRKEAKAAIDGLR